MTLKIEIEPELIPKLTTLQRRVNRNVVKKIDVELENYITMEQIAVALVKIGLALRSEDPLVFKIMVELHEMAHD